MGNILITISGYPKVSIDGRSVAFATRQDLGLLCYLALNEGQHSREKLVGLLWPGYDHDHGFTSLRGSLSRLRRRFDRNLDARRATVELLPVCVMVDRSSGVVFDGFSVNPVFDSWLASVRNQAGMVVPSVANVTRSEISHIAEYCSRLLFPLIYRNEGANLIADNYHDILRAFCVAQDGPDLFVLARVLYHATRHTGRNVITVQHLLAGRDTTDERAGAGIIAAQSLLSLAYSLPASVPTIATRANHFAASTDVQALSMVAVTRFVASLQERKILLAAEQSQIAAAYALAAGMPERIGAVVSSAYCTALASQWHTSRSYLHLAHSLINEYGSFHLLPSCAVIQKRVDTYG